MIGIINNWKVEIINLFMIDFLRNSTQNQCIKEFVRCCFTSLIKELYS